MKIGIYLAYAPHKKGFSLKQEGLGRYMASLFKAFCDSDYAITIACPKWSLDAVYELLEENNISKDKIEFVYPRNVPILLDLYLRWGENRKKARRGHKGKISLATINLLHRFINYFLAIQNVLKFVMILLVFAILLLPIGCIALIVLALAGVGLRILSFIKRKKYSIKNILKEKRMVKKLYLHLCSNYSREKLLEIFRQGSAKEIIRNINAMVEKPDLWYCPMAFWPEFNVIQGTKVVCAPDMVTEEFAYKFSENNMSKATEEVRKTIEDGKYFITYCNYLKQTLLIEKFGKKENNVIAIPHAVNDSSRYVDVSECFRREGFPYDVNMRFARIVLKSASGKIMNVQQYISSTESNFSMDDVSYIFYASQVRGNKNILNLVKAYEYMLREKNISLKLFLTANVNSDRQLHDYIYNHRLQYDVLFFNSVTNQQLAALYKCAELVVNPTFYEGGFPFTFGEGMSVGTPSVMSKIPQVTEVLSEKEFKDFLFDPYDVDDMVEKITYGLHHRDELYKKQLKVFEAMNMRTWEDVGREYVEAFKYFIEKERKEVAS